ncbi:N-acetylglucosaminyl-phosphatidylinositol de-N-acetylase [Pichia californica]|uniref:N-acetylglucosaminylphosphatidylinositol deacetylase n=1 Tax=Pichia californica TaxID=460514 RepID=A0A9P6WHE8_9ASCO|nr:N-acetylglucosaminyl-phosphatidylinositol de-N-acetylase [[Candida] californica]KAG0687190.1 N-acetylglucosaminyl-phosphatidylinositol de-N-acetylase [[Candida] californica]
MGLLKISYVVTLISFLWVILTTVLPNVFPGNFDFNKKLQDQDGYLNTAYYNSLNTPSILNNKLINSHIMLFTAHPDDESMFFTPSITELTKENYNNTFHLICLSNGGYDGLGVIRERELFKAAKILDIDSVKILEYVDNINQFWNTEDIINSITYEINLIKEQYDFSDDNDIILLTFDKDGVSNHPNHKSVFLAVEKFSKISNVRSYSLKSWNIILKYSGILFSSIEIAVKWLCKCNHFRSIFTSLNIDYILNIFDTEIQSDSVTIYSDLNSLFLNYSTMTWVHYSQIVWFRWIWIFTSKYMNSNELVPIV